MKLISDYVIITKADKHYLNVRRKNKNSCEQNVRQGVTDDLDQPTRLTYFDFQNKVNLKNTINV